MQDDIDLKDFISQTIIDICLGIKKAQRVIFEEVKNVPIAPAFMSGKSVISKSEQKISFDIMISASSVQKTDKGGSAKISVIGGSINKENSFINTAANRVQFSIPFYPQALEKYKENKQE